MLTRGLTALALLAVAHLAAAASLQPADAAPPEVPPVFRCIFEDRSRMVVIHPPGSDLWVAFNPGTCGVQKIWRGGMEFRGKVWDFSQDNCRAASGAQVMAEAKSVLLSMYDEPDSPSHHEWQVQGVEANDRQAGRGWRFTQDGATLISPVFDASGWQRVFVAFDERSRAGAFRIDISADGGATWDAQSFLSTIHGTSDTDWQFNFKLIEQPSANMRIRITQELAAFGKQLRRLRVFGDRPAWSLVGSGTLTTCTPVWRGYEITRGLNPTCTMTFALRRDDGTVIDIRHTLRPLGVTGHESLHERIELAGLKTDEAVRLRTPVARDRVVRFPIPDPTPPAYDGEGIELRSLRDGRITVEITTTGEAP